MGSPKPQASGKGGMRRAWDDLEAELAYWNGVLEREGLGIIDVGPRDNCPRFRARGRKDIVSLTPAIEARVTGSIWDLSATVDALAEALMAFRFDSLLDGEICEMLSRRIPWHRIARTLRCSKRRVSRVSRTLEEWRREIARAA